MLQERNAEQPPDLDMEIRPSPRDFRDFGGMLGNLSPCAFHCLRALLMCCCAPGPKLLSLVPICNI